ncbi:DUF4389 domain-containing protein [Streptomyces sp. VRA16 Mangrove soil]|uniref:DUF4389 domain-containing protein n=1 Tax=Streptomyces sp. VRA16 Mangrove soil TaxID=2817434 RepID=UPI001A9DE03C|nr:DUF4389 domain-containing protein [Streptomyces sp. VRA16 Mangrove soil]MBO1335453.1 DUF4389 domain-containing protein [Streptomyces sp. VRA16 Mangrove soil]
MTSAPVSSATDRPIGPVTVEADYDPALSRWLWLVKWLLALPHYLVLALLFVGFAVVWVIALFAILFTARFPRVLFDYNLGVLRWAWRVTYYTYGSLGTDRYPPFTLGPAPDYPARLDIAYPQRLSRGLVLVKWWLLVLPQALLVSMMVGGTSWAGGVAGLLVFYAGVALLFTGGYPRGMYDFNVGLHRYAARVTAYSALMTDVYPPFRLDQGGREPARTAL